jgi:hypothetical protein
MYDAQMWALCLVQGPFSVARCQTLIVRFATFTSLYPAAFSLGVVPAERRRLLVVSLSSSLQRPSFTSDPIG